MHNRCIHPIGSAHCWCETNVDFFSDVLKPWEGSPQSIMLVTTVYHAVIHLTDGATMTVLSFDRTHILAYDIQVSYKYAHLAITDTPPHTTSYSSSTTPSSSSSSSSSTINSPSSSTTHSSTIIHASYSSSNSSSSSSSSSTYRCHD